MPKTDFGERASLDHALGVSPVGNRWVSFHTADPGDTPAANELTLGGYARQPMTFGAAATTTGVTTSLNTGTVSLTFSSGTTQTVTHFGVWDAATGGNCWRNGAVTTSRGYASGDTLTVAAGALSCTED